MESRQEQVTREDLLLFINACYVATGQREFYEVPTAADAKAREAELSFLHAYISGNYRRLYARTLATGINHFARARIVHQLLASGRETPIDFRSEENELIRAAVHSLPPQRAYKLFVALREANINNRRARAVVREYIAARPDSAFDTVKYRSKVRAAATHAHLRLSGEIGTFLFGNAERWQRFETPLFEAFRQARFSQEAIYRLPYTVAEGLAARYGIRRATFLSRIAEQMTQSEKERSLRFSTAAGITLPVDLARMPLTKLVLYALALPFSERQDRLSELETALRSAARYALRQNSIPLPSDGIIAAVLDASYSASGTEEKRRRPLAIAMAIHYLLREAVGDRYHAHWCGGGSRVAASPLLAMARGATDLTTPLLAALEQRPRLVLIVSDGYENAPPEGIRRVHHLWQSGLDPQKETQFVHLNPVFATDEYAPRTLSPEIPTLGVRDAEAIGTPLAFARFTTDFTALENYLREASTASLTRQERIEH